MGAQKNTPVGRHGNVDNRPIACALFMLAAILGQGFAVRADMITLTASKDNTLYEDQTGAVSNGAGSAMFAGRNALPTDSIRRAALAFDLASAIPAGSVIEGVALSLTNSAANTSDQIIELHRLRTDWGEGSSATDGGGGAPAALGDATWLHNFYDTEFWNSPGGDFESLISATAIVGEPGTYTWGSTAQLVADVQDMLDHPNLDFGWILLGNETASSTAKRFATREVSDPVLRPLLTVEYTPVPEPSTGACLLTAALLASRRLRWRAGAKPRRMS